MRLVDADYLRKKAVPHTRGERAYCADIRKWAVIVADIDDAPTIDAVPVVHGQWVHLGGDEWCCSACGNVIHTEGSWEKPDENYCPNCGAKMDGGNDAENH